MKVRRNGVPESLDAGERELTPVVITVTASGDTTAYTPTSGKCVRLRKIKLINNPSSETNPLITVKLGSTEVIRGYVIAERQRITGAANAALIVNLSQSGSVSGTAYIEEVDP